MADPMDMTLRRVVELARSAPEAREWNAAYDEDGNATPPTNERQVLVFVNGDVQIGDVEGRHGGGWGVRFGFFDVDKRVWRADYPHDSGFITHWMDLPLPPESAR